jgi:hypothetical protein
MVPPFREFVRRMQYVSDAPLYEWQRIRAFDSAQACQEARQAAIDAAEMRPAELTKLLEAEIGRLKADLNHPNEAVRAAARQALPLFASRREKARQVEAATAKLPETDGRKRYALGMRLAQCVTSDDPRLK